VFESLPGDPSLDKIHNLFIAYFNFVDTYKRQPMRTEEDLTSMKLFYKRAGATSLDHDLINSALYIDKYIKEESSKFFGTHLAQSICDDKDISCHE